MRVLLVGLLIAAATAGEVVWRVDDSGVVRPTWTAEAVAGAAMTVDERLPGYQAGGAALTGIAPAGSDSLNNLMTIWCEALIAQHPGLVPAIEGCLPTTRIAGRRQLGLPVDDN
jgi:hypothetical protein